VAKDSDIADDLIPARLRRSRSYHSEYGKKTFGEIKKLAASKPPDKKAQQMKKLIVEQKRLLQKLKGRRS